MEHVAYEKKHSLEEWRDERESSFLIYLSREKSWLKELGESITLSKKQIILEPGQKTDYCYVVKRGRVCSYEILKNGEERMYHFYEKGALFLEEMILSERVFPVGFKTLTSCSLVRIHKAELLGEIEKDPKKALDIMESTAAKLQASMEQVRRTKNHNVTWKICDVLLTFCEYYGKEETERVMIREKISQQMISNLLGANRVTVVRAIKDLKDKGLVELIDGFYYVNDVKKLMDYQKESEGCFS